MVLTQPNFHSKTAERTVEKGGSRKGSHLEGQYGLTPAGKTPSNSYPQRGLRRRKGTREKPLRSIFRVRLPSVDTPVHKASSRITGSSINNCCLFRHIGQTREALSPHQARGILFCHTTYMYFALLPSNMNDRMFGHFDAFLIFEAHAHCSSSGCGKRGGDHKLVHGVT